MYLPDFLWQIHLQHVLRIIRRLPKISPFFQLFVLSYFSSYSVNNKLTKKPIVSCCLLDRRDERLELQYFRGTTLLHSFKNALISDAITSCFINVKPTFKSYQPDHSMVSSKFHLSCLAPTDNSLTKTFLLLLHFLVFCAFIISPHFHLCKHFLTFIFRKRCNQKKKGPKQGANFIYSILKFFFLSQIQKKHVYALFEQTLFLLGNAQKIQGFH